MDEKKIEKIVDKCLDRKLKSYNKIIEEKSTYKKVEGMLKHYKRFERRITFIENNMDNIILKKSSGILAFGSDNFIYKSDLEKKEEIREQNKKLISKYQTVIDLVDAGLKEIENDQYYKIIELRYLKKESIENISEILNCGVATVKRNRNRLINELCEIIFPEEILEKIF